MLKSLSIRNYALIRRVDLEFGPGLTIITGETGAGKSIMLGALSLVMGGRADTKVISDANSKSVVEALFINVDPELRGIFDDKGIEWIENENGISELIVRRELSSSGRSKVYVNDTSVTLQTLSAIVPRLLDIHSQHANAKINDASERLLIIDSLAGNYEIREKYSTLFNRYVDLRRRINHIRKEMSKSAENLEFLKFQFDQLDKLKPKKGELREIESRVELLSDADDIKERLQMLSSLLGDSGTGLQSVLADASAVAEKIDFRHFVSGDADGQPSILTRLKSLLIEAKDIYETVDDYNSSVDSDPETLARLSSRLNAYYEAVKRFHVEDGDKLVDLYEDLKRKISEITLGNGELPELEKEAKDVAGKLRRQADALSDSRRKSADEFSHLICEKARPLGLPNILFKAEIKPVKLTSSGQDEVEFLCSFNKNGVMRPINEIASGGEISRMMLSLKSILAGHINLPTIIFDEVDTGVSGEIADKMGGLMRDISSDMQVIVITHLPQVAAKGDYHFKVYKNDTDDQTETHVKELDRESRVRELASMISGSEVTEAALQAARALLG